MITPRDIQLLTKAFHMNWFSRLARLWIPNPKILEWYRSKLYYMSFVIKSNSSCFHSIFLPSLWVFFSLRPSLIPLPPLISSIVMPMYSQVQQLYCSMQFPLLRSKLGTIEWLHIARQNPLGCLLPACIVSKIMRYQVVTFFFRSYWMLSCSYHVTIITDTWYTIWSTTG